MPKFSKDQRNQIYQAVASSELDPAECMFTVLPPNGTVPTGPVQIKHNPSGSELRITNVIGVPGYNLQAKLGNDPNYLPDSAPDFSQLVDVVRVWADRVADWVDTPDLWVSPPESRAIPGALSPDSANTPFTAEEQAALSAQLKAIAETVKRTYELTAKQSSALDNKFEEAEKASRRMGRKDWGLLFGGAVFSLILTDAITPGIAGHILMMIEHGIGHLFSGPPVGGVLSAGQD